MRICVHSFTVMSSMIASVAPLLDRCMIKRTMTTKKAQAVLTADSVIMVCLLSDSPRKVMERMVPVAEVIPGMMETRIPAPDPEKMDRNVCFLVREG